MESTDYGDPATGISYSQDRRNQTTRWLSLTSELSLGPSRGSRSSREPIVDGSTGISGRIFAHGSVHHCDLDHQAALPVEYTRSVFDIHPSLGVDRAGQRRDLSLVPGPNWRRIAAVCRGSGAWGIGSRDDRHKSPQNIDIVSAQCNALRKCLLNATLRLPSSGLAACTSIISCEPPEAAS